MSHAIVTAELGHIKPIALTIRDADRDELAALYAQAPEEILTQSFCLSKLCWTGLVDDVPICMFGVVELEPGTGRPWMIGTTLLEKHQIVFLRNCRDMVEAMHLCFDHLENYVDARNKMVITWLKWLGFKFDAPEPLGPLGLPFLRFTLGG